MSFSIGTMFHNLIALKVIRQNMPTESHTAYRDMHSSSNSVEPVLVDFN